MSFNFPNSPSVGQSFTPVGGPTYEWDGTVWRMSGTAGALVTAEAYNRVVNGAMQLSQEYGFNTTPVATSTQYAIDQWRLVFGGTTGAPLLIGRSDIYPTDAESNNWLRLSAGGTVDASVAAGDVVQVNQPVEGNRIADFKWGTPGAKAVVLRFRAAGNAGTYCVSLREGTGSRSFVKLFTVTTTPQWFSFAIPGDTGGTWVKDTTNALFINFCGMAGTTNHAPAEGVWSAGNFVGLAGMSNIMAVASQTLDITNVGLYLDPQATGKAPQWQTPDFASELLACQRYWNIDTFGINAYGAASTPITWRSSFPATMRVNPTMAQAGQSASNCTFNAFDQVTTKSFRTFVTVTATGNASYVGNYSANARM
jgi:hypothetical protein